MAVVWTSSGRKTTSARAVGTGQGDKGDTGPQGAGIVLWEEVDDPTQSDVTDNDWADGTVLFRVL